MGEIDRRLAARHGHLLEEDLGLHPVPGPPLAKPFRRRRQRPCVPLPSGAETHAARRRGGRLPHQPNLRIRDHGSQADTVGQADPEAADLIVAAHARLGLLCRADPDVSNGPDGGGHHSTPDSRNE